MKYPLLFLLFLGTLVHAQTSMKAKQLLDQVATQLKSYENMDFDFTYTLVNQKEDIRQETTGKIWVSAEKYRLEIPEAIQIFDGNKRYTIVPENEEVTVSDAADEDEVGLNPMELLYFYQTGYDYHMDIQQKVAGRRIQYVKLIPADQQDEMNYLLLGIDMASLYIYRLIEIGKNGTQTTLTINNFKTNQAQSSNRFIFDAADYADYYINN